ncbi:MAG TPA: tetratricopeptide repeat protein [Candidatus Rifleibacterium sp.]|nr:tetratricopeptide repeat protein [Candidatus Rifleibacterium sp.]
MASPGPEKLTQLAEEIVEALGYQLFINDEEPENDPERKKYRQLVQLIEMELSAELFVATGKSDDDVQPTPDAHQPTSALTPITQPQIAKVVPIANSSTAKAKPEPSSKSQSQSQLQPLPNPPKASGSTQIRLINHQEEKISTGAALFRSLSLSSASVFGIAIAAVFLAGFLTAQHLFGDKNSTFFQAGGNNSGKAAATQKDSKQQRAAKAFFMMAKSELEKKNYQAARESCRMALSLEPDNQQYQEAFKQIEALSRSSKKKTRP